MNTLQNTFWSSLIAAGPMTLAMMNLYDRLSPSRKSPLPPATLLEQTLQKTNLPSPSTPERKTDLTMLSHFAYGFAAALLYSGLRHALPRVSPTVRGGLFGLGVWGVGYMGWIPAFGFRASAYRTPPSRNGLMILAHVVWGMSLGSAEDKFRREGEAMWDGQRKAPLAE
ncbi:MAG: DUF1440 domain-containing protein [Bdellovibrionaceae bacterium]|nr:DUF1440 domain-containing protein [Pseudobdellovibrionaceae bacterium]MBX3034561.1 DUF1440 domain-containing protein [Pseudobdellovibrionaceae bacterium]